MKTKYARQDLIEFENTVIEEFKKGETYGPVHLSGGNEERLIELFHFIKKDDWVFSTHRSHYHALLKSKDPEWLMDEIIKHANSSHINSKKYKIFTSAIVGGNIPIAMGVAMGLKRKKSKNKVWCFVGDMASEMGQFAECVKYAAGHKLPIKFVIENNKLGCNTPTRKVWSGESLWWDYDNVITYDYVRKHGHYGIGEWVIFKKEQMKTKGDYSAENIK